MVINYRMCVVFVCKISNIDDWTVPKALESVTIADVFRISVIPNGRISFGMYW